MTKDLVLRCGMFGWRGTGKTAALTALHLCGAGDGLDLEACDAATIAYFRPLVEGLRNGAFPPATPPKMPDRLEWLAHTDGRRCRLQCIDFAGELADPIWKAGPAAIRERVVAWFAACDAVLLFLDSTDSNPLHKEAIDALFYELECQATGHGGRRRTVVVVMTKGDRLPGASPAALADPERVDELLAGHPVYQRLRRQLRRKSDAVVFNVFLVSAVGWAFEGVADPKKRFVAPCNLFAALRWAVQAGTQLVATDHERALAEVQERAARWDRESWGLWPQYPRLLRELDEAARRYNLREGPFAGWVAQRRRELLRMQRRQRIVLSAVAVVFALLLLFQAWRWRGQVRADDFAEYDRCAQEHPDDGGARERLAFYDARVAPHRWDWFWGLQARRTEADAQAAADRRIQKRIDAEEAFGKLIKDDTSLDREHQGPRRHEAALAYLAAHGDATPQDRAAQVRRILDGTADAWGRDRDAWREAAEMPIRRPADYAAKIDCLIQYARRADALNPDEARQAAQAVAGQQEADKQAYQALRDEAGRVDSAAAAARVEGRANAYLGDARHGRAMADAVRGYLEQINAFHGGREVYVTVKEVTIPRGALNLTWTGNPNVTACVKVGDRGCTTTLNATKEVRPGGDFSASVGERLGPFVLQWGRGQALTATVEVHRSLFRNEVFTKTVQDDVAVVNQANGMVETAEKVRIGLECPGLELPRLPVYGDP